MTIYLLLNNKIITGYSLHAIENAPAIEVDDPNIIQLGIDTYENEQIIVGKKPATQANYERILELKQLLADSDYLCLKHADGELTDEEYASIKAQRHAWRAEINELEA